MMNVNTNTKVLSLIAIILSVTAVGVVLNKEGNKALAEQGSSSLNSNHNLGIFGQLDTDLSETSINLDRVFDGGPGKDGIPAIYNPEFVTFEETREKEDTLGIFIDINGDQRFYPYSILVWHEIVNDVVGGENLAITFCPLCGSAIVYDREIKGELLSFGVSGLLYESNLLMYDVGTESLWSQALGEAVVGEYLGAELTNIPLQLLSLREVKEKYPETIILSRNTGFVRNYGQIPYEGYEDIEETSFPVSVDDKRFFTKEIMYVVPYRNEVLFAFPKDELRPGATEEQEYNGQVFTVTKDGGEINVYTNGEKLPGYFEMWFSFATHHQEDGVIWEFSK